MNRYPFLAVFLFLTISDSLAQSVFRLDSLPSQGVVLDKGWKWQAGDNPDWARADFDDGRWDTINPTQDIASLHQFPQQGIGWLRIHLRVAPLLQGRPLGLYSRQVGATEIFLNGKLTGLTGTINAHKQVEAGVLFQYNPFVRLSSDSIQVISVRYAFSSKRLLKQPFAFFRLTLLNLKGAETREIDHQYYAELELFLSGLFLVLGVLQLLLYALSNEQRATLYLGLYLVTQGIVHLSNGFRNQTEFLAKTFAIGQTALFVDFLTIVLTVSIALSSFLYLLGSYLYFRQPKNMLFWVNAAITGASIPVSLLFPSYWFFSLAVLATIIPFLDILRVGWVGIRSVQQKKTGARLFTVAHTFTLVIYTIWTVVTVFPTMSRLLSDYANYLFAVSFLALALTISFLLAQERAAANKLLRKQLIELEALSQKTIVQEQEKQQILATQNELLEQQVEARTAELKASQAQLIQKEKLASLGELTAGIAHEIQNPLNFVNNFSEVSTELVTELEDEQQKPARDPELEAEILGDLKQNLQKITHHGNRASSIVKGMLEHSRASSGERQLTDLNTLADEYLRLAYQGQRAKDKGFNAELKTDFDPNLGLVEVVSQEIGRVLLNLYNNAFYAVQARQKQQPADYQPTVWVSTRQESGKVLIRVRDNGTGIPDVVKDKIFQPFFTTKPTGEGTGLGLSLSYDIITKGHGGTLTVESVENQGTTFMITLPISRS